MAIGALPPKTRRQRQLGFSPILLLDTTHYPHLQRRAILNMEVTVDSFRFILLPPLLLSLAACGNRDDDAWAARNEIISEAELASLREAGLTIHDGRAPPLVEGVFLADSLIVTFDSTAGAGAPIANTYLSLSDQTENGTVKSAISDSSSFTQGVGSIISGSENCFSIYTPQSGTNEGGGCKVAGAYVISACISNEGLVDFQFAYINQKRSGNCTTTVLVGHRRIMKESDGIASRS